MDLELPEVCIVSHCCFCSCCLWPGTLSDPGLNACPLNEWISWELSPGYVCLDRMNIFIVRREGGSRHFSSHHRIALSVLTCSPTSSVPLITEPRMLSPANLYDDSLSKYLPPVIGVLVNTFFRNLAFQYLQNFPVSSLFLSEYSLPTHGEI